MCSFKNVLEKNAYGIAHVCLCVYLHVSIQELLSNLMKFHIASNNNMMDAKISEVGATKMQ
jgi:hypothetical protein